MKEHAIFMEAAFTRKNYNLAQYADNLKCNLERLLIETTLLSRGIIRPEVSPKCYFVTNYTVKAEKKTEYFTAIPINTDITMMEIGLNNYNFNNSPYMLIDRVHILNQKCIAAVNEIARFKSFIENEVLSCKIFIFLYPHLINHILREAKHYLDILNELQNGIMRNKSKTFAEALVFWNHIMEEHSEFIRGFLDPEEENLINTANEFAKKYEGIIIKSEQAVENPVLLPSAVEVSTDATLKLRDFKSQGTKGILECKVRSIILPLLADHVLREANYYLQILSRYKPDTEKPINK